MQKNKHLWITDTHIKILGRYKLLNTILDQKPYAVFMTGDFSEGFSYLSDLEFIGKRIGRPLYFVRGNHELWGSSFAKVDQGIRDLTTKYKNLIWMTDAGIVPLNEETSICGIDGWYDGRVGNSENIKYTFDWFMIEDFRKLPNMKARIELMREIADNSAKIMSQRLEEAFETYKMVYLLTHIPTHPEANRADSWLSEEFWKPYNCNFVLGQAIDKVMEKHKKRYLCILSGHNHRNMTVNTARNSELRVGKGSYLTISDDEIIYI